MVRLFDEKGVQQRKDKRMFRTLTILVSLLAIIASISSVHTNGVIYQKMENYVSIQDNYKELIALLYGMENYLESLLIKYQIAAGDEGNLKNLMSNDEIYKINSQYITSINILLGQVFITMSDESYEVIDNEFLIGNNKIKDIRESLLVIFRKSNYPQTKFKEREDIKLFFKYKGK